MDVRETQFDGSIVLAPSGRIDLTNAESFKEVLLRVVAAAKIALILDLSEVDYISSAALRRLLLLAKKATDAQGKVVLTSLRSQIRDIFDMAGFTPIFPIYATQEEAVRSF